MISYVLILFIYSLLSKTQWLDVNLEEINKKTMKNVDFQSLGLEKIMCLLAHPREEISPLEVNFTCPYVGNQIYYMRD